MEIILKNVGKIYHETSISLNGITILAGENGVGKSTIGKVLYCVFNTFYDYDAQIREDRIKTIFNYIRIRRRDISRPFSLNDYAEIERFVDEYAKNPDLNIINKWISDNYSINNQDTDFGFLTDVISAALSMKNEDVLKELLISRLNAEFNMQIGNVNYAEESKVTIRIKDEEISFKVLPNDVIIEKYIRLVKNLIYIDDPHILDDINYRDRSLRASHRNDLINKILKKNPDSFSAIDSLMIKRHYDALNEKISTVCSGGLSFSTGKGIRYKTDDLKEDLFVNNLSSGLKSYIILKTLLMNGYLDTNGIMILDEPEIHLHPEWMKIYAEIIVIMKKTFDLNILISTHSSDFLSFIELYSKKYDVANKCKYYMLEKEKENEKITSIVDVTDSLEIIYKKLGTPFLRANEELDGLQ